MADHNRSKVEEAVQVKDELVDGVDPNGVETGGRLVEQHDFGVGRQRPGQRRPFEHAARQFGRKFGIHARPADLGQALMHFVADGCF